MDYIEEVEWPNVITDIQTSEAQKSHYSREWSLGLQFLKGNQWVTYDKATNQYTAIIYGGSGETKVTVNLLLNIYRNILSKLTVNYPGISVAPSSPSFEDIVMAQATEMAIKYYWTRDDIKTTLSKSFEWLVSCGTVALHTYYDPGAEHVHTEVVNPYDLVLEPYVTEVEDSDWVAMRRHTKKSALIAAFPDHADYITKAADSYSADKAPGFTDTGTVPLNRLETFEVYWQDGRHAIILGSEYLYKGKNPLPFIPVQIVKYTEMPGELWGKGLIAPLIDLQWLYNKARTQVVKNIEDMANPKWLIPKAAGILPQQIQGRSGEKIYYNQAGGRPEQISAAPFPGHVLDNINRIQSEIMDVSGIHSTSLGKRAVGVSSGKAIDALSSQDSSQLQITQARIEQAVKKVAEASILLMKNHYTKPKMLRMFDDTGEIVYNELKAESLVSDPDIFLQAGSLFRSEQQDRDGKILEYLQLDLISKETAVKELSFKTGNAFVSKKMRSLAHARDLLVAAKRGYDIEIFRSDDLDSMKEVFGECITSPNYYRLTADRQEYLRDVYLAIEYALLPVDERQAQMADDKVFPKVVAPTSSPQKQGANAVQLNSGAAQVQTLADQAAVDQKGLVIENVEEKLSKGSEALMGGLG